MKSQNEATSSEISRQIFGAVVASLGNFVCGNVFGWSSSILIKMKQDFVMGDTESALVVSSTQVGGVLGCLMVGFVMDFMGRKKAIMATTPFVVIGWLTMAYANSIFMVYVGRSLTGISYGFLFSATVIYIGETCEPNIRGRLGTLPPIFLSLGALTATSLGAYLPWRTSCLISVASPVILFLLMLTLPETPYWYLLKNRKEEAETSLRWFRGPKYDISVELKEISAKLEITGDTVNFKEFFKSRTRTPLLIALFAQSTHVFSGATLLTLFTVQIFESGNSSTNMSFALVLTGIVQVIGSLISMLFVDRFRRKSLLASSSCGIAITIIILGYYFLALEYDVGVPLPPWLPMMIINSVIFLYCLGCRSVPWIISSEIFNTKIRSKASSILNLFFTSGHFCIIQIFPYAVTKFGYSFVFFFFGALNIAFAILTMIIVPETKGKSLSEIQEYFDAKPVKHP